VGKSIGFAYAINTIGAVSGSFCAGFVLIPLIGKENGLSLVIGLQLLTALVIAVVAFGGKKERILKWVSVAVPALAGLLLCFYFPMWDRRVLSKGKYHRFEEIGVGVKSLGWVEALLRGSKILGKYERGELVYYGDGIGGFTTSWCIMVTALVVLPPC
jgi:spermidine synthase